jgi:hypothetical protein
MYFNAYRNPHDSIPGCQRLKVQAAVEPEESKLHGRSDRDRLARLAYPVDPKEDITLTEVGATGELQTPHVALRVPHGWLTGADRGEWGGELMFIGDDATRQMVLQCGVEGIYRLGDRIVTTCGTTHLSNLGELVEVAQDADGRWIAKPWRILPGAPRESWIVDSGELLVRVVQAGDIVVNASGSMRMAPCEAVPVPPRPH